MSFSPTLSPFQAIDFPSPRLPRRQFPERAPRSGPPPRAAVPADHPVRFMGTFLLATSLAVIGLWQGMGLLLPH
jgi:hypothetical protein